MSKDKLAELFPLDEEEEEEEVEEIEELGLVAESDTSLITTNVPLKEGPKPAQKKADSPIVISSGDDESNDDLLLKPARINPRSNRSTGSSSQIQRPSRAGAKGRVVEKRESRKRARYKQDSSDGSSPSSVEIVRVNNPKRSKSRPDQPADLFRRSNRLQAVVEIPLKPLNRLKTYALHSSVFSHPDSSSRRDLLDGDDDSDYASSSSAPTRSRQPSRAVTKKGPSWRTEKIDIMEGVFESGSEGALEIREDDSGEEESDDETGDSQEDSDVIIRRSKRKRNSRNHQKKPSPRHTRARKDTRSSRISASPKTMRSENRTKRKSYDEDEESEKSGTSSFDQSEGEEELDEIDEDEYQLDSSESSDAGTNDSGRHVKQEDFLSKHRQTCEKCQREPAADMLRRARQRKKKGSKKRRNDDEISDEELANMLDGWLKCTRCVIASHWGCLGAQQQRDVLSDLALEEGPPREGEKRRRKIDIDETYRFTCSRCSLSPKCFVCHRAKVGQTSEQPAQVAASEGDNADQIAKTEDREAIQGDEDLPILFRCTRCKQACHYEHMDRPPGQDAHNHSPNDTAKYYQTAVTRHGKWVCHNCHNWDGVVDLVCAWRPWPANAVEEVPRGSEEKPNWKDPLPREYLVKWVDRGFRHATWVTHPWMMVTTGQKLRNFLEKGPMLDLITDETLAARGDEMTRPTIANVLDESEDVSRRTGGSKTAKDAWTGHGPPPDVDAENSIPQEWKTVDRVLDVYLFSPKAKHGKVKKRKASSHSGTPEPEHVDDALPKIVDGIRPPENEMMLIDEWEDKTGRQLTEDDVDEVASKVAWCFVKWDDLQYDQSCWDTPPPVGSALYLPFKRALKKYLSARLVEVPILTRNQIAQRELDARTKREPPRVQPDCIVGGTLMKFQLEGFQWLLFKHFKRESCILADDMGLGKTIQIASLLGYLGSQGLDIYPMLVVVPNSTITNWVREFEKWVPHMRVVPFYGVKASRKVISKYELYHPGLEHKATGLKTHIVLTTYDVITSSDFRIFSGIPRWEVLCVDEGQRLKSDSNVIFNRLKSLNSVHRILLTGTPLNNNLRELFNLLNFLDDDEFKNLQDLEARFTDLNEGLIQELHELIRPYILRRIKADVLKLPPKIEIIVPISLAPLQKNVYKTILEKNGDTLRAIAEARRKKAKKPVVSGGGQVNDKKKRELDGTNGGTATLSDQAVQIPQGDVKEDQMAVDVPSGDRSGTAASLPHGAEDPALATREAGVAALEADAVVQLVTGPETGTSAAAAESMNKEIPTGAVDVVMGESDQVLAMEAKSQGADLKHTED